MRGLLRDVMSRDLLTVGVNAVQVQMWLGHHSPAFTQAVYVHLLSSDLPDGDLLDNLGGNTAATRPTDTSRDRVPPEGAQNGLNPRSVSSDLATSGSF